MADFEYKDTVDYKFLDRLSHKNDQILIGYPSGRIHQDGETNLDELARKLSFGAGPQDWTTNTLRETGLVGKNGKVRKKRMLMHHHVEGIPARPFLEDGLAAGKEKIQAAMNRHFKKLVEDGKGDLHRVAAVAVAEIQKFVRGDTYKNTIPNSRETIYAKKSDHPLIDTADLINGLTSVINGKESGVK
jgi:hypothetical protein